MKAESGGGERGVDDEKKAGLFSLLSVTPSALLFFPHPPLRLLPSRHHSTKALNATFDDITEVSR